MARKSKNKSIDRQWSQREFGVLLDASPAAVSRYVNSGVLTNNAPCEIWIRELHQHLSSRAAGREGNENLSLHDERARLAKAQTDKILFDLKKSRNEFVSVSAVALVVHKTHGIIRNRLLGLAHQVKGDVPALPTRAYTSIDGIVRECLAHLGHERFSPEVLARVKELDDAAFKKEIEVPSDSEAGAASPAVGKSRQPHNQKTK